MNITKLKVQQMTTEGLLLSPIKPIKLMHFARNGAHNLCQLRLILSILEIKCIRLTSWPLPLYSFLEHTVLYQQLREGLA